MPLHYTTGPLAHQRKKRLRPQHISLALRTPVQRGALLDDRFFKDYPDRNYRIREPVAGEPPEFEQEFLSLGDHDASRRRVIVKRMDRLKAAMFGLRYMPIPFLLFADESISDSDAVLGPIFDGIMKDAAASHGM